MGKKRGNVLLHSGAARKKERSRRGKEAVSAVKPVMREGERGVKDMSCFEGKGGKEKKGLLTAHQKRNYELLREQRDGRRGSETPLKQEKGGKKKRKDFPAVLEPTPLGRPWKREKEKKLGLQACTKKVAVPELGGRRWCLRDHWGGGKVFSQQKEKRDTWRRKKRAPRKGRVSCLRKEGTQSSAA